MSGLGGREHAHELGGFAGGRLVYCTEPAHFLVNMREDEECLALRGAWLCVACRVGERPSPLEQRPASVREWSVWRVWERFSMLISRALLQPRACCRLLSVSHFPSFASAHGLSCRRRALIYGLRGL
jgi:hypothetical protein